MIWSAEQYVAFEDQRTRPVRDLLAALPGLAVSALESRVRTVIDLGCGPGNSTELLAARFAGAAVRGLDSSADMIAAARKRLPDVSFEVAEIERWLYEDVGGGGSSDVILANAVLQWVPNHARLIPALVAKLATGGWLAVQMPDNLDEPTHRLMREIAADGPWAAKLASAAGERTSVGEAGWYYDLLRATQCRADVWRTTYYHALADGAGAIVEWFKGSGLRPYIDPLAADERAEFLARYQAAVARAYPALADGSVLLPFPRLFMIASR